MLRKHFVNNRGRFFKIGFLLALLPLAVVAYSHYLSPTRTSQEQSTVNRTVNRTGNRMVAQSEPATQTEPDTKQDTTSDKKTESLAQAKSVVPTERIVPEKRPEKKPENKPVDEPEEHGFSDPVAPVKKAEAAMTKESTAPLASVKRSIQTQGSSKVLDVARSSDTDSRLELPKSVAISEDKSYSEFWVWLGIGAGYQYHEQDVPSITGGTSFQNINVPSVSAHAGFQGKRLGLDLSYRQLPGQIKSSKNITVVDGEYQWRTLSGEVLYRLSEWNLRVGVQHHSIPFMVPDQVAGDISVTSNTLMMVSLGFDRSYQISERLRAEWLMRYQHKILAGASDGAEFKVSPQFAFDGSVGGVYRITPTFRAGVFWYGQVQSYEFDYDGSNIAMSGKQMLFDSNFEFRVGWEF
jgi:hypothetical protein